MQPPAPGGGGAGGTVRLARYDPDQPRDELGRWTLRGNQVTYERGGRIVHATDAANVGRFAAKPLRGKRSADEVIAELVADVTADRAGGRNRPVPYRIVDRSEAERLRAATGLSLLNVAHTLDRSQLVHAWKGHEARPRRHELPLTAEDLRRIPEITADPDRVERSARRGLGGQARLLYRKRVNGHVYLVEEQVGSRLRFVTMWKVKASPKEQ
jgi:hypothetical protein